MNTHKLGRSSNYFSQQFRIFFDILNNEAYILLSCLHSKNESSNCYLLKGTTFCNSRTLKTHPCYKMSLFFGLLPLKCPPPSVGFNWQAKYKSIISSSINFSDVLVFQKYQICVLQDEHAGLSLTNLRMWCIFYLSRCVDINPQDHTVLHRLVIINHKNNIEVHYSLKQCLSCSGLNPGHQDYQASTLTSLLYRFGINQPVTSMAFVLDLAISLKILRFCQLSHLNLVLKILSSTRLS